MDNSKIEQMDRLRRYGDIIHKQSGQTVNGLFRADGYVNLLNRYGTKKDMQENYFFMPEAAIPDETLIQYYEGNGLFAKIIDTPADEVVKHGFELEDIADDTITEYYKEALDELDWEETLSTAIRWARLFGGSIAVMLINDGRGIDEPVDWKNIQSIDGIRVYDRSVVQPDYQSLFTFRADDPFRTRGSKIGEPEYYYVYSRFGHFVVHNSRCLVFRNGTLPENCTNSVYMLWGMPEYVRIQRAIRDTELAHSNGPKMLEKSVQAIYRSKNLSELLATQEGEDIVLKRLQLIDMARGFLNSIAIDSDGEDYDFKSFSFTGVSEIIDTTCNLLSALTSIPQTILFGRSPAGMNATGSSDMENYYNYVEKIQKRMVKNNLRYLLQIIFKAGVNTGKIEDVPKINIEFSPLWSMSEMEKASLEQTKAATQQVKAATTAAYVDMGVLDPSEVRAKLAEEDEYNVETILDDIPEEELFANFENGEEGAEQGGGQPPMPGMLGMPGMPEQGEGQLPMPPTPEGGAPDSAPTATEIPQDMSNMEQAAQEQAKSEPDKEPVKSPDVAPDNTKPPQDMGANEKQKSEGEKLHEDKRDRHDELEWITVNGTHVPLDESGKAVGGPPNIKGKSFQSSKKESNKSVVANLKSSVPAPFDSSKINVDLGRHTDLPKESVDKVLSLCGARSFCENGAPDAGITLSPFSKKLKGNAYIENNGVQVMIEFDDTAKDLRVHHLNVKETGKGTGTKVMRDILFEAKNQGYSNVELVAEGKKGTGENGYYTWPRLGFDGELTREQREQAKKSGFDVKKVSELMNSDAGRRYWRENGSTISLSFDLSDGSDSMKTLEAYSDKKSRNGDGLFNADESDDNLHTSSVGVLVIKDGKILCGERLDEENRGKICGPGGHVEIGETAAYSAVRETDEEFGIIPDELIPIGYGTAEENGQQPYIFLCDAYSGVPECDENEMTNCHFETLENLLDNKEQLFKPFADSLDTLINKLDIKRDENELNADADEEKWITINGTHVKVKDGEVVNGPAALRGQTLNNAKGSAKQPSSNNGYIKQLESKRDELKSKTSSQQALALYKSGFLSKETSLKNMKNGSISDDVDRYFDFLEKNGDPTPTKETVSKQKSLADKVRDRYNGDWSRARIGEIVDDTGMSEQYAARVYSAISNYTSGWPLKGDKKVIDNYIERAPAYSGHIFRGLHFDSSDDYDKFMETVTSGDVTMNGNSSWSSSEEVARRFGHLGDDECDSVMIRCVANKTATPIEHLTQCGGEQEVIAHSKTGWSVMNIEELTTRSGRRKALVTVIEKGNYEDE